ncbi:hypothetical protein G7068_15985 [Leucobacter viscericola]|uniref:Uncharacterized protein n=1 Tax=Leucobacter viscericola TaxID=2714935 RepID=A0A6G7XJ82_9MICO|nr:hypothetical protein [Leucobacter viscericola]QIK61771.1 hypothetical protein G7068_00020 [Leucobacter viscericola]QIK64546.1 hypothetical protein G7068_15985 [Leucobacter viscericola]
MAGKPKVLTDVQQAHFETVQRAYAAYVEVRDTALARAKIAAEAEVSVMKLTLSKAMREARASGVPMRRMGAEIMGTKDYYTVQRLVQLADHIGQVEESVKPAVEDLAVLIREAGTEAERIIITLSGEELLRAKDRADWAQPIPGEFVYAEFVQHESGKFIPLTEGFIESLGEQHPVVAWADLPSSQEKLAKAVEAVR